MLVEMGMRGESCPGGRRPLESWTAGAGGSGVIFL